MSVDIESRLRRLRTQRTNAKRSLTTYERFLEKFDPATDFPALEKRYREVEVTRDNFEKIQEELEVLFDDPEGAESYRTDFEEKYFTTYSIATNLLANRAQSNNQSAIPPPVSHSSSTSNSQNDTQMFNLPTSVSNLPKINLPMFSGSYDSWLGFYDLFNSLVNEDPRIPAIQKLFYLKGCLSGEAADVIASIELSADNYDVAWKLLKDRYDNRVVIRQSHAKALIDLPCISKDVPVRALLDNLQKHLRALKALGEPVDTWDTLLIVIIREKLNNFARERWEEFISESPQPTMKEMIAFLQRRAQLDDIKSHQSNNKIQAASDKKTLPQSRVSHRSHQVFAASTSRSTCSYCKEDHSIFACKKYERLTPVERYEAAKKASLCLNCLRSSHRVNQCSSKNCRQCNQRHHTLLHFDKPNRETSAQESSQAASSAQHPSSIVNLHAHISSESLLATAVVDLVNKHGESKPCRVFLDAGSQAHFITKRMSSFLNLDKKSVEISVTGVGDISTEIQHSVTATIKSRCSEYRKTLEFLVVPRISKTMPSIRINRSNLEIPKNIVLADPDFYKPADIDLLIGVKLFYKLLCVGQLSLKGHSDAVLQKTQLGWIVAGEINSSFPIRNTIQCHFTVHSYPQEANLTRFWEMEEISSPKLFSFEEKACEEHFKNNTQRDKEGRYIVRLPFNEKKDLIGESGASALKRLHSLESRLAKNPTLKREYREFLKEYRDLNHMSPGKELNNEKASGFYLPHHAVVKKDSVTTKTRVVFDGSAKSSTGVSLNDTLMIGPKIQDDLFVLLIRFRSHPFALTADIEKMYRQVKVHPDDAIYQKILFRFDSQDPVQEYTLDTVTYGTSCASFLAIRTLHQLAEDEGNQHPVAAAILKRDFYVDDLLTGAKTYGEAVSLRDDLLHLLKKGGFSLRKWASNDQTLISKCSENPNSTHMSLDPSSTIKTLGIQWNARGDFIFYSVNLINSAKLITKRSILSQVAKLFDPLGLLGPVIVRAKVIIQLLWKAGVSWDESIPLEIHTLWLEYKEQLPLLSELRFDRCLIPTKTVDIQLHGFCDASEKAYGACLYLRSIDDQGKVHANLVCSKSRVAPVTPLTLPRLELSAALLLARLQFSVRQALQLNFSKIYLWSDATIALHWIGTEPHLLKTFVSNRVAEIQGLAQSCYWRHVPSLDNPADLVSRGQTPHEFLQASLWQNGPEWLYREENLWPQEIISLPKIPELRSTIASLVCLKIAIRDCDLLQKYSSIAKLTRVVAYIFRFVHNAKNSKEKVSGPPNKNELDNAILVIMRLTQSAEFSREINNIKNGDFPDPRNRLTSLNPFIDDQGILRVGGRLAHADLPESQKHPILLPSNHHVTYLIIREEHLKLKHAGPQSTLYSVREFYWPLKGRSAARKIIHQCVSCFRAKPRKANYTMGMLPQNRVSCSRPFLNAGVDYCGPLFIKEKRFRNRNKLKVYVAIFVCLSTKAVHLEVVSDLTTEAFIASLKRFFSRRGKSASIYSDNATNFVGANRELNDLYKLLLSTEHNEKLQSYLCNEKISWHFIPPNSPHFGGIWEAAVKSFKHHLVRTVGNTLLTFEQLETYVIEIEAILNSRPLSPMSSDPHDIRPLTPAHFLIGGPLTSFPQLDFKDSLPNRLSAWQHAQQMKQHFWTRWQKEYLNQLISRSKWKSSSNHHIEIGTLVLIQEDNLPPLQWALGRITAIHPGEDGIVRVVTLATNKGEYKRCVRKLCPLPIE